MASYPHPRTGEQFESPVPAGSGWPGDPADPQTPIARTVDQVAKLASMVTDIPVLDALVSVCAACPRLVSWREDVARTKRRAFAAEPYWGRPVTGWGSQQPRLLVLGLAPAAHGGNRTGRMFTGDRSGDQLFASLYRTGLVSSPLSIDAADGLQANAIRLVASVRCAPPGNAPTPVERNTCAPWLQEEWRLIAPHVRVIVALGGFGWGAALRLFADQLPAGTKPKFGHGAIVSLSSGQSLMGCYHPSQHNMFTGRLTPAMLDEIFAIAAKSAGIKGISAQ